jgi:hypothetical protein
VRISEAYGKKEEINRYSGVWAPIRPTGNIRGMDKKSVQQGRLFAFPAGYEGYHVRFHREWLFAHCPM